MTAEHREPQAPVTVEQLPPGDLIPNPRNARTHSEAQVAQLAGSMREFGFTNPVLIDDQRGILAGHARVLAALKLGLPLVPCIRLSTLTPWQRKAYMLADNRLAELAGWDREMLALELGELKESGFSLELTGFTDDDLKGLLLDVEDGFNPDSDDGTSPIACLCAALCGRTTRLYAVASCSRQVGARLLRGSEALDERQSSTATFGLDYEPGIQIGDFQDKPKVQKYHTQREFYDLFREFFGAVRVDDDSNNVQAICSRALPPDPEKLAAALAFEFDLPYPDGSRMGLVEEARAAFRARGLPC